jgi:outer membrane protein assembly factor BamB
MSTEQRALARQSSAFMSRLIYICTAAAPLVFVGARACADDWPQWLGPQRDGVWRETGIIDKFPEGGPKILWRVPLGAGYCGPSIVGERVYVMDRIAQMDASGQPVRAAGGKGRAGNERVLCLSAADGHILWKHEYDCPYQIGYPTGPRVTPVVNEGRVYTLGAMGDLLCLDAADGTVRWSKSLKNEYHLTDPHKVSVPYWGYASHPLIDGELLYCVVGGPGTAVVAFNKDTGKEVWRALSTKEVGYSPPMIYEVGGKRELFIWLSEAIYGLDPATGRELWKHEYPEGVPPQRPAVNIITVKKTGDLVFISTYYHGPMMLKLDADKGPSVAWKGKSNNPAKPDGVHALMVPPIFKDGYGYACGSYGDLRCFKAPTGEQVWQTYAAVAGKRAECGTVFLVPQGDRYVLFNDRGDLILAELSPQGYHQIDRAHILEPATLTFGRDIVWSHPGFAHRCVYARNDKEMVCVSMAK